MMNNWHQFIRTEFDRLAKPANEDVIEELAQHAAGDRPAGRTGDIDQTVNGLSAEPADKLVHFLARYAAARGCL